MKTQFTILFLMVFTAFTIAQIPNAGFENWTSYGNYEDPDGWATMNSFTPSYFNSCSKNTDHYPTNVGNYSIKIENNTSLTQMTGGYGMVITDIMAYPLQPSFPIIGHPTSLHGYFKYFPQNGDALWIQIIMFKNGANVFNEQFTHSAQTSTWTPFEITFPNYTDADSATIIMAAFHPTGPTDPPNGNSVLMVDNLNFDSPISSINEKQNNIIISNIFPNPANTFIEISINNNENQYTYIDIIDITGKICKTVSTNLNNIKININDLKSGVYFLRTSNNSLTETRKLMVN